MTSGDLSVLTRNIDFRSADALTPLAGLKCQPDIVALQGASRGSVGAATWPRRG